MFGFIMTLAKFGIIIAILCGVVSLVLAPFAAIIEWLSQAKYTAANNKRLADNAYRQWEKRVENAIRSVAYGNDKYWERPLVNESIKKPGHNQRVMNALGAKYSLVELGKMGLVAGAGQDLGQALTSQKKAQQDALARLRAAEARTAEETRRNQQRWMNQ